MTHSEISRKANLMNNNWPSASQMSTPAIRRGGRGGTAWSLPKADKMTCQPQDGSVSSVRQMMNISSHLHSNVLNEPEDARLTGGTRTLTRRLLGLNVGVAQRKAVSPAPELKQSHIA